MPDRIRSRSTAPFRSPAKRSPRPAAERCESTPPPSLANGSDLNVSAGTLEFDLTSGGAVVGTNVSATVAPSATLQLAGTNSALSDGSAVNPADGNLVTITNNGSTASGGGLLVTGTNQSVGVVSGQATSGGGPTTYSGDTVVGNGSAAASLTVTQLLQNSLTINAGSTVTIRPSGSGISNPGVVSGATTSVSSATASTPIAATPAASVSDPFLGVQSAMSSGNMRHRGRCRKSRNGRADSNGDCERRGGITGFEYRRSQRRRGGFSGRIDRVAPFRRRCNDGRRR